MPRRIRVNALKCVSLMLGLLSLLVMAEVWAVDTLEWPALKERVTQKRREQQPAVALQLLLEHEARFSGEVDYDYQLGLMALECGELSVAEIALERVVLVNPGHAGAWLDLAIVNFRQGDIETAEQLVDYVSNNFDPPQSLKAELDNVRQSLQQAPGNPRHWHGVASLAYGYDNNANYGLMLDNITLTPTGSAPIALSLDKSSQPQGDFAGQFRGYVARRFTHAKGRESQFIAQTQARKYSQQSDFDLIDASVAWRLLWPLSTEKDWYLALTPAARHIALGGDTLGEVFTGSLGAFHKRFGCDWGGRLDFEKRLYAREGYTDATLPWANLLVSCESTSQFYGLTLRYGQDYPDTARAGGQTDRHEANLYWRKPLTDDLILGVLGYVAYYTDALGYNPLLDQGKPRTLWRFSQKMELNLKLPYLQNWWGQLELEHTQDTSNIPLNNIENLQGYLGIRYHF